MLMVSNVHAQTERFQHEVANPYHPPTHLERYKIDYEVKNWTTIDEQLLDRLDLAAIEAARQLHERVEWVDAPTGLTIIIYSVEEAGQKKALPRNAHSVETKTTER